MFIDRTFENKLEDVEMIFMPLNKTQHQSESNGANIWYIISRWIMVNDELKQLYDRKKFSQLNSIFSLEGELLQQFEW